MRHSKKVCSDLKYEVVVLASRNASLDHSSHLLTEVEEMLKEELEGKLAEK